MRPGNHMNYTVEEEAAGSGQYSTALSFRHSQHPDVLLCRYTSGSKPKPLKYVVLLHTLVETAELGTCAGPPGTCGEERDRDDGVGAGEKLVVDLHVLHRAAAGQPLGRAVMIVPLGCPPG